MTQFAVCLLPQGEQLVVETDDDPDAVRRTGAVDKATEMTTQSFEKAVAGIRAAADLVRTQLSVVSGQPNVTVEFGVKIATELGAVIARSSAEANVKVQITWKADGGD